MKAITTGIASVLVLSACAGGSDVQMPDTLEPVPILEPFNPDGSNVVGKTPDVTLKTISSTGEGEIVSYIVKREVFTDFFVEDVKFFYKTQSGEIYPFSAFGEPIIPDFSAPDKNYLTTQNYQPTSNGGKIFGCCNGSGTRAEGIYVDSMRYGIWVNPNGQANFFIGGIEAPVDKMLGADANNGQPTGKVTYHVWAFRNKGDKVAASSYLPRSWGVDPEDVLASKVTVNFNTGKLGGKIIGNDDFGADIDLTDVDVNGNTFSGIASSDGFDGVVEGAFYGKGSEPDAWYKETAGKEIGGVVTFAGQKGLDSVFGGSRAAEDADDKSTDLTPLD